MEALDVDCDALGVVRDAAMARRAIDFRNPRRLAELPHQGVLASAAADDEDFHSQTFKGRGREKVMSNAAMAIGEEIIPCCELRASSRPEPRQIVILRPLARSSKLGARSLAILSYPQTKQLPLTLLKTSPYNRVHVITDSKEASLNPILD